MKRKQNIFSWYEVNLSVKLFKKHIFRAHVFVHLYLIPTSIFMIEAMRELEIDDCLEEDSDCDDCEQDEIDAAFSSTCVLLNENLVERDKYVLNLTATL